MYKTLIILPFLLLTVQANGKFSILQHPSSLEFKGNDKLDSTYLGDVLGASLGLYIDTESKWDGFYIKDPFQLPKGVINVLVEGVNEIHLNQKTKTFSLSGESSEDSLNMITSTVEAMNSPVVNVDLNDGIDSLLTYTDLLGKFEIPLKLKSSGSFKPDDYPQDKLFLQQISAIKALSTQMSNIRKKPSLINIRLSLNPLIDAHGADSPIIAEALKTLSETIVNFGEESMKAYENQVLFTVATDNNSDLASRKKRETTSPLANNLNLAARYSQNYPVIFNIILWFMVVFVFALLAISYTIATMDPGRDSIIYRMTSTRMKKDN